VKKQDKMGQNLCGSCQEFKPESGKRFFNCLKAEHAALKYGMQVRVDSQACDAFAPN